MVRGLAPILLILAATTFTSVAWGQTARPAETATPADPPPDPAPGDPRPGDDVVEPPADPPSKPADPGPGPPDVAAAAAAEKKKDERPTTVDARTSKEEVPAASPRNEVPSLRDKLDLSYGVFTFDPILLVQVHAVPYLGGDALASSGDDADSGGFRLRRGRLGLGVEVAEQVAGRVSVELGTRDDGDARIVDAWVAYVGFPYAQVFLGAQTVPMSRSAMTGAGAQALAERPLVVRSMAPREQIGAVVRGEALDRAITYDFGVFNGFTRRDRFYEGYAQNVAPLGNRFEGLAYSARLGTEPLGAIAPTIAAEGHGDPRFALGASYFYSDGGARGIHTFGADGLLHVAGLHVLAEVLFSKTVPASRPTESLPLPAEVTSVGLVGEVGYVFLPRLLGVTARVEWIDPSTAVTDEGDAVIVGGGPTLYVLDGLLEVQAEIQHREELGGQSLANDALLFAGQIDL